MKCNIARDLFPLYFDGLCSDDTGKQLEEHLEHCESCRQLKQSLEKDSGWSDDNKEWNQTILPLKKFRKKMRRKNGMIILCMFFLIFFIGVTALLTYGQIFKKGISFELIYDAVRLRHIGEQFASGNITPLYETLSDGFVLRDDESAAVCMVYTDKETYDAEMKEAIMTKYRRYFEGKDLTFKGIEEISYFKGPQTGWNRTIYIALKFEGEDHIEYYICLYKDLDGKYMVRDYFGSPYLSYTQEYAESERQSGYIEPFHTEDSLFSCMPDKFMESKLSVIKQIILLSGQRALQGDTTLAKNGQMRMSIRSERDIEEGTNDLQEKMNEGLDKLIEWDYYVTNIFLNVKEYDKTRYLYRYQMNIELTGKNSPDSIIVSLDCYKLAENFVYIDDSDKIYGNDISPEIFQILEGLYQ